MNKTINFAIGIHNHQPVGNFNAIFKDAFNKAYIPFLKILEKHPRIKISLHFSGPLIDYMAKNNSSLINLIRKLVKRGQVEILAGAYYEPILSNLTNEDIHGQISTYLETARKIFKYTPKGMWLAERVWEPHLAEPIRKAGINYTLLDESHFRYAGLEAKDIFNYYVTEEKGYPLHIFPISFKLRYSIPFQPPQETIEYLREFATKDGGRLATFGDDGEKFGIWPGTHDLVYTKKWLEEFFRLLEKNRNWINLVCFSEFIRKHPPSGRIYLPATSYFEMTEWALPAKMQVEFEKIITEFKEKNIWEKYEPFLKGGYWRNFLTKYEEVNNIQKKSIYLSRKISQLKNKKDKKNAQIELWKGQCNCAYWHGVFGGLYLPHLRDALYSHLIHAEKIIDSSLIRKKKFVNYEITDYNNDSFNEIILKQDKINLYFSPSKGGSLYELNLKEKNLNLINTLGRKFEAYHQKIKLKQIQKEEQKDYVKSIHDLVAAKEDHLEKYLVYDKYPKYCLLDHFIAPEATLEDFKASRFNEDVNFALKPYQFKFKKRGSHLTLELSRNAKIKSNGNFCDFKIQKNITLIPGVSQILIEYILHNLSKKEVGVWFGTEFNFNFLNYRDNDSGYFFESGKTNFNSTGEAVRVEKVPIQEANKCAFQINIAPASSLWYFPIETVSLSEAGFEKIYQGSTLLFHWRLRFKRKGENRLNLRLNFK